MYLRETIFEAASLLALYQDRVQCLTGFSVTWISMFC